MKIESYNTRDSYKELVRRLAQYLNPDRTKIVCEERDKMALKIWQ
jgi:hypothetical protein